MVQLANRAQVLKLLTEFDEVKDKLTSNELEMYSQIKEKYTTSDEGSFDDKICLEVILRNVNIRQGYGMDKDEATRVINLETSSKDSES
ncbi:MAG: Unknown protein [uncultured Thiotrichaceae bacterium]|uniref:Uncharacterized protein n=1 Tax=uncultured Thiotrichaceae bacterium TaxID=298394 RepID=A0A6S6U2I6_9GAMM|nr:MAG: Unknown protein [uncultured Thiotrichaceae bacterium]